MKRKSTSLSALIVMSLSVVSAILGFGRESYIAYLFGATKSTDAYYIALIVTDVLAGLIGYVLTNAIVPVLKREILKSRESAMVLSTTLFWGWSLLLLVVTILTFKFRDNVVLLFAPGVSIYEHDVARQMLGIMAIAMLFSGLTGVVWGIHNAWERYTLNASVGVLYNISMLAAVFILHGRLNVMSLAYGFVAGVVIKFGIQAVPLFIRREIGFPLLRWHRGISEVIKISLPISLSVGVGSISLIVDRFLASGLMPGDITDMNFGMKIGLLPGNFFGTSLATTLYPKFASHYAQKRFSDLSTLVKKGITVCVFMACVVTVLFICYANNIIGVLFYHGAFSKSDMSKTSGLLILYGVSQVSYLLNPLLTHFLYAINLNRLVVKSSVISLIINILGSLTLVRLSGIYGLVEANMVAQIFYLIILLTAVVRHLQWTRGTVIRVICEGLWPGIQFGGAAVLLAVLWHQGVDTTLLDQSLRVLLGVLGGGVTVVAVSYWAKSNFVAQLVQRFITVAFHRVSVVLAGK